MIIETSWSLVRAWLPVRFGPRSGLPALAASITIAAQGEVSGGSPASPVTVPQSALPSGVAGSIPASLAAVGLP
jgi:hypothetical protein